MDLVGSKVFRVQKVRLALLEKEALEVAAILAPKVLKELRDLRAIKGHQDLVQVAPLDQLVAKASVASLARTARKEMLEHLVPKAQQGRMVSKATEAIQVQWAEQVSVDRQATKESKDRRATLATQVLSEPRAMSDCEDRAERLDRLGNQANSVQVAQEDPSVVLAAVV